MKGAKCIKTGLWMVILSEKLCLNHPCPHKTKTYIQSCLTLSITQSMSCKKGDMIASSKLVP